MRCRRSSFRLLKILTSSFWRTSPTTKLLLGLHPACLFLPPHLLLPTLLYPNEINESLSQTYPSAIISTGRKRLSSHSSPYRSLRAFKWIFPSFFMLVTSGLNFQRPLVGTRPGVAPDLNSFIARWCIGEPNPVGPSQLFETPKTLVLWCLELQPPAVGMWGPLCCVFFVYFVYHTDAFYLM